MARIVVLTGAGISAESGLGTFRDEDSPWRQYDLSEVATPEGYEKNPSLVLDFYNARRKNCREATPNKAHKALARLSRKLGDDLVIVTQNIDDLHERAGARGVMHMHGRLEGAKCAACGHRWDWGWDAEMTLEDVCPNCSTKGSVRPDVVWFGEIPHDIHRILDLLADCQVFAAIGTSGAVYPAAGFVRHASAAGAETHEVNLVPSDNHGAFDRHFHGSASEVVPRWVDEISKRR
ncbi:MAG: NAD-dependent deacylase [Paracoccaceae bacterium]